MNASVRKALSLAIPLVAALSMAQPAPAARKPAAKAATHCTPTVRDGWIRLMPGGMPMQAGFGRFENGCAKAVGIVAASSAAHGDVSLHETTLVNGVSRMRAVPVLNVPAKGSVELEPGGLHLMLMQAKRELKAGEVLKLQFKLGDGGTFSGDFVVKAPEL